MTSRTGGGQGTLTTVDIQSVTGPLVWVRWANSLVLLVCLNAIFAMAATLAKGGVIDLPTVLVVAPLAFAGWIAWRNVTVLSAVAQPLTVTSLSLLAIFGLGLGGLTSLVMASGGFSGDGDIAVKSTLAGAVVFLLLGGLALPAAISVLVLRGKRIPLIDVTLASFMKSMRPLRSGRDGLRLPARNAVAGWALLLAGGAVLFGVQLIPDEIYFASGGAVNAMGQIGGLGCLLLLISRAQFEPTAERLLASDHRPPVLFLRSFLDDERTSYQQSDTALWDFSLEARLTEHFSGSGPFIAVGSPKDKSPVIGAARATLSDQDWQTAVVDWMDRSAIIIVMAGVTGWINWELKKVVERGHVRKLIVVFPQMTNLRRLKDKSLRKRKPNAEARLANVREAFSGSAWQAALDRIDGAENIRALHFEPSGGVTVMQARSRDRNAYHLAVLIAHALMGGAPPVNAHTPLTPPSSIAPAVAPPQAPTPKNTPAPIASIPISARPFREKPLMRVTRRSGNDERIVADVRLGAAARGSLGQIQGARPPLDTMNYEWSDASGLLTITIDAPHDVRLLREGAPYPEKMIPRSSGAPIMVAISPGDVLYVNEWKFAF